MTAYLLVSTLLAVAAYAVAVSGGQADSASSPVTSTKSSDLPADYWRALAVKRLAGWRHAELQRNHARARVRAVLRRRGTGIPFLDQALCVHTFESLDWHWKGHHRGGMQFNFGTWRGAGGRGDPADAHPMEQLYRAWIVVTRDGSWREWSTRGLCGL